MQRYFIAASQFRDGFVTIEGDDAHHLTRVMRAEPGDECICSNGADREVRVRIVELGKNAVTAEIVEELPLVAEAAVDVWVAQSLPKGDKMELVIQKGTEIGAAGFMPFVSARTVVQYDAKKEAKRSERWSKIAKEAAEQAHRNRVPAVEQVIGWKPLMAACASFDAAWICYEQESGSTFRALIRDALSAARSAGNEKADAVSKPKLLLIVGPEGGFTSDEVAEAQAAGCKSISLGKRILRTETAAMVGLTCILYESGEMGE